MLKNEIPMDKMFLNAKEKDLMLIQYNSKSSAFDFKYLNSNELTRDMLPDKDAYFELHNPKIDKYLQELESENEIIQKITVKTYSKNFVSKKHFSYQKKEENEIVHVKKDVPCSYSRYYFFHDNIAKIVPYWEDEELFISSKNEIIKRRNICNLSVN